MANKSLYPVYNGKREIIDLSGLWKFTFDKNGSGLSKGYENGISNYIDIPVPAAYNEFFTDREKKEFTGDVWYEKEFYINEHYKDKDIDIRFFGALHKATVYLNGVKIGYHKGGFLPFTININNYVKFNKPNKLVVKLNNELDQTTLPVGETITLKNGTKMSKPYFDFFNYGGIQRPVKIVITPKNSIVDITLNHKIVGLDTITNYDCEISGHGEINVEVYDQRGNLVSTANGFKSDIKIKNTTLWKPLNAYLYKFVFKLYENNVLQDVYELEVGIRTVKVKGKKLLINNEPVYLKGFGKHEDADVTGRGFNLPMVKRDFELIKWINANSFRTSHYPYSEEIYQMAEREGIMIIDEIPAVGLFKSMMNALDATKSNDKKISFFDQPEVWTETLSHHKDMVRELVARDKNYACVIMWSLLNEPDTVTSDNCVKYFEEVFDLCKKIDIQKRPRTFALVAFSLFGKCKCHHLCDVIMLNRYQGWYFEPGSQMDDSLKGLEEELKGWETVNKPIMFSEYGADCVHGLTRLPATTWTENYQVELLSKFHEVFDKFPGVIGEQIWNFADFDTTDGFYRVDGNKKGLFTRQRQPKLAAFVVRSRWAKIKNNHKA